jgi:hypothetical protein
MTTASLFDQLWLTLADMLGSAATAALLRRAVKRAAVAAPELATLVIRREGLGYEYTVPPAWCAEAPAPAPALGALVEELYPLLIELTGPVIVARLDDITELRPWTGGRAEREP